MTHHDPFINWTKYKKGAHSGRSRSMFWQGIAEAMADQWGTDGEPVSDLPLFAAAD